jgi:hypothetical protein
MAEDADTAATIPIATTAPLHGATRPMVKKFINTQNTNAEYK